MRSLGRWLSEIQWEVLSAITNALLPGREELAIWDHSQQNRITQKVNALIKPRNKEHWRISKQTWSVRILLKIVYQQSTFKVEKQEIIEENFFSSIC